jgi:hypothetical protein
MQSTLRKPLAAALLLSSAAALLAQPAAARERHYVEAPAARPAIVHVRDGDRERWNRDHDRAGWRDDWRRDNAPPAIDELTPEPGQLMGTRRATLVSASFVDALSGIEPGSVRLRLDGRDVTAQAQIDPAHIRLVQELWPGHHVAEVVVRDRAGNVARRAWQFEVSGPAPERQGEGYGRRGWR